MIADSIATLASHSSAPGGNNGGTMKKFMRVGKVFSALGAQLLNLLTDANGNGDIVRLLGILSIIDAIAGYLHGLPFVVQVFSLGIGAAAFGKLTDFAARPEQKSPFRLRDFLTDPKDAADLVRLLAALAVLIVHVKWWVDGPASGNDPSLFLTAAFGAAVISKVSDVILPRLPRRPE